MQNLGMYVLDLLRVQHAAPERAHATVSGRWGAGVEGHDMDLGLL